MKTIEIKMDAIKMMDPDVHKAMVDAMLNELMERRKVRDKNLFWDCFMFAAKGCETNYEVIDNFYGIAWEAFHDYHIYRKHQREQQQQQALEAAKANDAEWDNIEAAAALEAAETEADAEAETEAAEA